MPPVSPRIRIAAAIVLSYIIILAIPAQWSTAPYIPTKEEVVGVLTSSTIAWFQKKKHVEPSIVVVPQIEEQPLPPVITPSPIPTAAPTLQILPTFSFPTPSVILLPSKRPTAVMIPTSRPTQKPTSRPTPTSQPPPTPTMGSVPNYVDINSYVSNPPQIGCKNNTISGCPVDTLYSTPLEKGLGWATYYGDEHNTGYNVVADVIHNNKGITIEAARAFITSNYMQNQSDLTPAEAKKTGKVIAFGATRSPSDLWKIKYAFGIDDPKNPHARFIGRIMIIDCAASNDWKNNLATLSYSYKGWTALNWIVDLSKNGFIQLPTGYSGRADNIGEGRPGVILIDEASLDSIIY